MSLPFERKLPVILLFVVVVITVVGFAFYEYTTSLRRSLTSHQAAANLLLSLDETLRFANDIETGARNFVITGNETYLDPYKPAKDKLKANVAKIKAQVAENPKQALEVARLEEWINQFQPAAEQLISQRRQEGYQSTIAATGAPAYAAAYENIRRSIERLKAEEMTQMAAREQRVDASFVRTIWVLIIGSLAGVGALFVANLLVSREMKKRTSAEIALSEANKGLEQTVERRTAELKLANENLQLAAGEREKLLESEKGARREAEIANRMRDDFMATVSHELRTPLNSILGWARMLRDGELDQERRARALGTIIKNSETQKRLIEDLMDVARVMSGKLVLEMADVRGSELIMDAVESIRPAAEQKGISISALVAHNAEGAVIHGDKNRLMQVFTNLLTNAVKFTPEGGEVCARSIVDDGSFRVDVVDNGIGISPDFLPEVFERFRQNPGRGNGGGGLGLGLAIVKNLVEMHHGEVSVQSEGENQGSTFTVILPMQKI